MSNAAFEAVAGQRSSRFSVFRVVAVRVSQDVFGLRARLPFAVAVAVAGILLLGAGYGVVVGRSDATGRQSDKLHVLAVQTIGVESVTSFLSSREYTGTIVAHRTGQLGFERAGRLEEILVDEGTIVTVGMAIARLDTETLLTRKRQLVAKRAQASAKLDEMIAGPREEDIAAARARVAALQAQVQLLKLQTVRHQRLVASNAASQGQYEEYAYGQAAREAELDESQHQLDELLRGTRQEQIQAQRAVVAELEAAVAEVEIDLDKSTLRAPFAGTIARRLADNGTVLEAGEPVVRLVEDRVLEAWVGLPMHAAERIPDRAVQRIKIGQRYFDATLVGRLPEVDPVTRTRSLVLRLDAAAADYVVHGQIVRLELGETVKAEGYWLPATALTKGARGLWTCFALSADIGSSTGPRLARVERRVVEVLHAESDRVLVRGTLHPNDQVIANGTHRVVPGQVVRASDERLL